MWQPREGGNEEFLVASIQNMCLFFSGRVTVTPAFTFDDILIGFWNRLVCEFLLASHPANQFPFPPSFPPAQSFEITDVQQLCFWIEDKQIETLSLSTVQSDVQFGH